MPPQSTYAEATPAWSMEGKTRRDAQPARDARQRLPRSFRVEAPPRPARRCASCAGWSRRPPPATAALLSPANSKERRPALPFSLSGQACQQRPPIRRLHVCTAGKALRHRLGQIAPLHWGRGLVGYGVEPAVPLRPLAEQPRLPTRRRVRGGPNGCRVLGSQFVRLGALDPFPSVRCNSPLFVQAPSSRERVGLRMDIHPVSTGGI